MISVQDTQDIENSAEFQRAWKKHVEGNDCYDLSTLSQPEVDAFRFAFLCGYIEGDDTRSESEDEPQYITELRESFDRVLRTIVISTFAACGLMAIAAFVAQKCF